MEKRFFHPRPLPVPWVCVWLCGEDLQRQELSLLLPGRHRGAPLRKTVWQFLRKHSPTWVENLHPHKNLHTMFMAAFHNWQNLKATKMCFDRWLVEQTVVHPCSEILLSLKKKWTPSHEKTQRKLAHIVWNEGSQSEKSTYCIIPTMWHSRKGQNYGDSESISGRQRLRVGGRQGE